MGCNAFRADDGVARADALTTSSCRGGDVFGAIIFPGRRTVSVSVYVHTSQYVARVFSILINFNRIALTRDGDRACLRLRRVRNSYFGDGFTTHNTVYRINVFIIITCFIFFFFYDIFHSPRTRRTFTRPRSRRRNGV